MNERIRRRRGRTRWLLITSVTAIAVVMIGTELLLQAAPMVDNDELVVDGVPQLDNEEVRSCTRGTEQATIGDIRASLTIEGRVSSSQVFACPMAYDGALVTYVGEAIGELLHRDGGAWIQVNDDAYALETGPVEGHRELSGSNTGMSVWLPDELHEAVQGVGRSGRRGDIISVTATVHRADPDDGGGITLRVHQLDVLRRSQSISEPLHRLQAAVAAGLTIVAAMSLLWARRSRQG